ncbi:hypothetical protein ACOMHN_016760 [Nucella lapillus]
MAENGQLTPYKAGANKDSRKSGQGNLTGHVRKLQDMAAELHNTVNKLESLNGTGHSFFTDIVNLKLQYIYQQNGENTAAEEERIDASTLTKKLEPKFKVLHCVVDSMEGMVKKMSSLTSMVHSIRSLSTDRGEADSILFSTWTIHQFADTLAALHAMYAKELSLKRQLCQNVAYADIRPSLMCFSAAWLHQPNFKSNIMVNALLLETGLS